jgi:hypothetical protein
MTQIPHHGKAGDPGGPLTDAISDLLIVTGGRSRCLILIRHSLQVTHAACIIIVDTSWR